MHLRSDKCLHQFPLKPMRLIPADRLDNAWAWWGRYRDRSQAKASRCVPTSPVALGKYLAAKLYGWTGYQWEALYALWNRESGWDPYVYNHAGSGACGIPQFKPCRYYGDAYAQIVAGLHYISDRYGSPADAANRGV
jgi:hypothetical protein